MTTVVKRDGEIEVLAKGSPERIMELCSLSVEEREAARLQIVKFQEKACRVIGFAHRRTGPAADYEGCRAALETDMVFDGFTAITDPIRADVYQAVERCRRAGIVLKLSRIHISLALCARKLTFYHPSTGREITCEIKPSGGAFGLFGQNLFE